MTVRHLGRLPYEVLGDDWSASQPAPRYQLMLALAMTTIDAEDEVKVLRRSMVHSRTPPKWRTIHAAVDKAHNALAGWD